MVFTISSEYIMVPAPYYYRINNDLEDRAGVHVLEVPLSSKVSTADSSSLT